MDRYSSLGEDFIKCYLGAGVSHGGSCLVVRFADDDENAASGAAASGVNFRETVERVSPEKINVPRLRGFGLSSKSKELKSEKKASSAAANDGVGVGVCTTSTIIEEGDEDDENDDEFPEEEQVCRSDDEERSADFNE